MRCRSWCSAGSGGSGSAARTTATPRTRAVGESLGLPPWHRRPPSSHGAGASKPACGSPRRFSTSCCSPATACRAPSSRATSATSRPARSGRSPRRRRVTRRAAAGAPTRWRLRDARQGRAPAGRGDAPVGGRPPPLGERRRVSWPASRCWSALVIQAAIQAGAPADHAAARLPQRADDQRRRPARPGLPVPLRPRRGPADQLPAPGGAPTAPRCSRSATCPARPRPQREPARAG